VKNPEPSKRLGVTHQIPIHFAHGAGGSVLGGPKKGPLNFVDELKRFQRYVERDEMVNILGGKHQFYQSGADGRSNILSVPSRKFASALILKVLEVHPF
jgi:hypothetical protein